MRKTTTIIAKYSPKQLKSEIMAEAHSIGLAEGFASAIADQVVKDITKWLQDKPTITTHSLDREVATLLKKYHADLAYLYENRGKII